jgi:hypothetical protein
MAANGGGEGGGTTGREQLAVETAPGRPGGRESRLRGLGTVGVGAWERALDSVAGKGHAAGAGKGHAAVAPRGTGRGQESAPADFMAQPFGAN